MNCKPLRDTGRQLIDLSHQCTLLETNQAADTTQKDLVTVPVLLPGKSKNTSPLTSFYGRYTLSLHGVCKCTSWSETTVLRCRTLLEESKAFKRIQIQQHSIAKKVQCDREFKKRGFKQVFQELGIQLVAVACNDYKAYGAFEATNRVLRHFYNHLKQHDKKATIGLLLSQ